MVGFGDLRTSKIVAKIADEELAHVAVGLHWFLSVCQKIGRAPCSTFKGLTQLNLIFKHTCCKFFFNNCVTYVADLLKEYNVEIKGPFNYSARDEVGIPRDW